MGLSSKYKDIKIITKFELAGLLNMNELRNKFCFFCLLQFYTADAAPRQALNFHPKTRDACSAGNTGNIS